MLEALIVIQQGRERLLSGSPNQLTAGKLGDDLVESSIPIGEDMPPCLCVCAVSQSQLCVLTERMEAFTVRSGGLAHAPVELQGWVQLGKTEVKGGDKFFNTLKHMVRDRTST